MTATACRLCGLLLDGAGVCPACSGGRPAEGRTQEDVPQSATPSHREIDTSLDMLDVPARARDTKLDVEPMVARVVRAPPQSMARRYTDGVLRVDGTPMHGPIDESRVVSLPYASSDVLFRFGQYDVLGEVGRGGMGVVYRAYAVHLCRYCAVKTLKTDSINEARMIRLQTEAMLAARLHHPNIVSVFDAGEEEGTWYFVMEYVDGVPFAEVISEHTDESMWRGLAVLSQVARALDHAHREGVVHRDIKPHNVLVDAGDAQWRQVLETGRVLTVDEMLDGEPQLTVLKPIRGTAQCAVCHAADERAGPGASSSVLSVLVVRRPLRPVHARIAESRRVTMWIASGTALALLLLVFLVARTLGVRPRPPRFGGRRHRLPTLD